MDDMDTLEQYVKMLENRVAWLTKMEDSRVTAHIINATIFFCLGAGIARAFG